MEDSRAEIVVRYVREMIVACPELRPRLQALLTEPLAAKPEAKEDMGSRGYISAPLFLQM